MFYCSKNAGSQCSWVFEPIHYFQPLSQLSDLVPASQANICCLWIVRTPYNNNTQTMNTRTWRPTRRSDCMVGLVNRLVLSQEWKHASLVICLTWQLCYSKSATLSIRKENIQILNWVRFWKQQEGAQTPKHKHPNANELIYCKSVSYGNHKKILQYWVENFLTSDSPQAQTCISE